MNPDQRHALGAFNCALLGSWHGLQCIHREYFYVAPEAGSKAFVFIVTRQGNLTWAVVRPNRFYRTHVHKYRTE